MAEKVKKEVAEALAEATEATMKSAGDVPERYIATEDLMYNNTWYKMGTILELTEDPNHAALRKMTEKEGPAEGTLKKYDPQGDYQAQQRMDRIYNGVVR